MGTAPIDHSDGICRDAYNLCLKFQANVVHDSQCLSLVRLFGYIIREVPASTGRDTILSEIVRCVEEDAADELARCYVSNFVVAGFTATKLCISSDMIRQSAIQ